MLPDRLGVSWVEHDRIREAYSQMLLGGKTGIDAWGQHAGAWLNVLLVAVHDHKMRFVGHHCLILDSTHTRVLEDRLKTVEARLKELEQRSATTAK